MKLSIASLSLFAAAATADFMIYSASETTVTINHGGWMIFDNEPDCSDVDNAKLFLSSSDLTYAGDVRCSGDGCGDQESDIDQLEMRFSRDPLIHLTMYKDREWGLYGVDGNKYGECKMDRGHPGFECFRGAWSVTGAPKMFCTYHRSASEIHDIAHGN